MELLLSDFYQGHRVTPPTVRKTRKSIMDLLLMVMVIAMAVVDGWGHLLCHVCDPVTFHRLRDLNSIRASVPFIQMKHDLKGLCFWRRAGGF